MLNIHNCVLRSLEEQNDPLISHIIQNIKYF